jgi:hypothetical protein
MKKILSLKASEINESLSIVIKGLCRAYLFLHLKCGLIKLADLGYELMLLPIFNIFVDDRNWDDIGTINKVEYWYWSSLFSGRYREMQNQRSIDDIKLLEEWINNTNCPNPFYSRKDKILDDPGYSDFDCLSGQLEQAPPATISAAILQYIISKQPTDFLREIKLNTWDIASQIDLYSKQKGSEENKEELICKVDRHHILPLYGSLNHQDSSDKLREDKSHILNSPLNFSKILAKSNKQIGSKSFDDYKSKILDSAKGGHFLPDFIERDLFDSDEKYYRKFLKLRYEKIKVAIAEELSSLA